MRHPPRSRLSALLAAVLALGMYCGLARAQDANSNYNDEGDPQSVPTLELQRPLTAWGLSIVFLFGCLALGFKSSKRNAADR